MEKKSRRGSEVINKALVSLVISISKLREDDRNVRKHSKKNLESIKGSLLEFGQQKPIVALKDGKVIAGNGTLQAAKDLGWKRIACVQFDIKDDAKAAAFAIADNRTSELAEWDFEKLAGIVKDLHKVFDFSSIGWDDYELEPLLEADWKPPNKEDMDSLNTQTHEVVSCKHRHLCDDICSRLKVKNKADFLNVVKSKFAVGDG